MKNKKTVSEANFPERSEGKELSLKSLVGEAYETFFRERLTANAYAFLTVNFDSRTVKRWLAAEYKSLDRPLTADYLNTFRADPSFYANHKFWGKFFRRFSDRILGATRSAKGQSLDVCGFFENEGKSYNPNATDFHSHFWIAIPERRTFDELAASFFDTWESSVMPVADPFPNRSTRRANKAIDIKPFDPTDSDGPNYPTKQLVNFELAAERWFSPNLSTRKTKNDKTT